jgi:transcriptional regulator with XRE-family HTH domain
MSAILRGMPDTPTGQLIRLYRIDRKKSTISVATHAGITVRYLEMIEAGTKTPTLHVLREIAKVLGVRTSALLGEAPSEHHEGVVNTRLAKLERALFTYRSVPLYDHETEDGLADISDRIEAAEEAWYLGNDPYIVLDLLPDLIVDTKRVVHESGTSPESCKVIYRVYRLARVASKHAGRMDLHSIAADRCMRYAEAAEDQVIEAAAAWTLGQAFISNDMPQAALDLAMYNAGKLEAGLADATPGHLSVYGGLLQLGAVAYARTGDPWRGREVLRDKALPVAERIGEGQRHHNVFFGPTNVGIHAVAVELENGDPSEALRVANAVDITNIASTERQYAHLIHVARCYELKCNDTAVLVHLKMAEKVRPQAFIYRREPRQMLTALVRRAKPTYASEVREFAERIGLLAYS